MTVAPNKRFEPTAHATTTQGEFAMSSPEQVFCNKCGRELLHQIAAKYEKTSCDGEVEITRTAEILECCGCGYTLLRKKTHFSEFQYQPGDFDLEPEYAPPLNLRQEPAWLASLDKKEIREVLLETEYAFNHGMCYLAAIGARTVLELVLVDKVGDIGTFEKKLQEFENQRFVTPLNKKKLDILLNVGNAAAHRGYKLSTEDLEVMMTILEQMVHQLYVQPTQDHELAERAERIGAQVPPRPKSCHSRSPRQKP